MILVSHRLKANEQRRSWLPEDRSDAVSFTRRGRRRPALAEHAIRRGRCRLISTRFPEGRPCADPVRRLSSISDFEPQLHGLGDPGPAGRRHRQGLPPGSGPEEGPDGRAFPCSPAPCCAWSTACWSTGSKPQEDPA
ncbi:hypothetical protein ACRAWD_15375 [Caulobacter segnis]